jgi:excisionase family DNA binding protein
MWFQSKTAKHPPHLFQDFLPITPYQYHKVVCIPHECSGNTRYLEHLIKRVKIYITEQGRNYNIPKGPEVPVRGKDVYTAEQAAELLGVTRSTVIRWVEVGLLKGTQLTDGEPWHIQVTGQDIQKLKSTEVGDDWLTLKRPALVLGVSQQTVLQKLKFGQLEGVRVCTGRRSAWRIHVPTDTYSAQKNLF